MNILKDMLLIEETSVLKLYQEIMNIAGYLVAPMFTIALLVEYLGDMRFGEVVKRLLIITLFMAFFYQVHTEGTKVALEGASYTLKKVNPRNLFIRKWYTPKTFTKEKKSWSALESFAIPNLNDFVATGFFVLTKIFSWMLKLVYSTVFHFTYVFSGITATLYFFGWTKDALKWTVQASLWCFLMPFVVVAILILIGNTIDEKAISGELIAGQIDTIVWLFGINLLLLLSPLITYGLLKGDGFQAFGASIGNSLVSAAPHLILAFSNIKSAANNGLKFGKRALFRPSVADEFRADAKRKEKLLNKKGSLRTPFRKVEQNPNMEERLEQLGITKEEAKSIVAKQSAPKKNNAKAGRKSNGTNSSNNTPPDLEKETFLYNEDYWKSITPEHRAGIRSKYGIETQTPKPNRIYRAIGESTTISEEKTKRIMAADKKRRLKVRQKELKQQKKGGTNELR